MVDEPVVVVTGRPGAGLKVETGGGPDNGTAGEREADDAVPVRV